MQPAQAPPGTSDSAIDRILARARVASEPVLRETVMAMPDPFPLMAGYHAGWWDADGEPTPDSAGKYLRPALVLATATACGGASADIGSAAAAVELIHEFSLLHDDVIDGDTLRRGRPTVWRVWGKPSAVLLGDAMHSTAIQLVAQTRKWEAVTRLTGAVVELSRGQQEDCDFETRGSIGVDQYIRMAMAKTGALMGCSCALGALYTESRRITVSAMERFGRELGLAFQFIDDKLGIWGDPAVTGKPVGSDLARHKLSLPVVAALTSNTDAGARLAEMYDSPSPMTSEDIARATRLIEQAGGLRTVETLADQRVRSALTALPDGAKTRELAALAHVVSNRNR
ncbi:polyprenyl synthetase [Nocardia sp. CS682]|nr:polyprenyl synthetase [Nocardia sp. CS682]